MIKVILERKKEMNFIKLVIFELEVFRPNVGKVGFLTLIYKNNLFLNVVIPTI